MGDLRRHFFCNNLKTQDYDWLVGFVLSFHWLIFLALEAPLMILFCRRTAKHGYVSAKNCFHALNIDAVLHKCDCFAQLLLCIRNSEPPQVAMQLMSLDLKSRKGGSLGKLQHILRRAVVATVSVAPTVPCFSVATSSFSLSSSLFAVLADTVVRGVVEGLAVVSFPDDILKRKRRTVSLPLH